MKNLTFCILVLYASASLAQKTNFNGVWRINKVKIDFGQLPQWAATQSYKITQDKDKITVNEVWLDEQNQEHPVAGIFKFDGSTISQVLYTGKKRDITLKWLEDKTSMQLTMHTTTAEGEPWNDITETWQLTDGGKTLSIKREVKQLNNGFTYTLNLYYDKQ